MTCRYCSQEIFPQDRVNTYSYWNAIVFDCHKDCKAQGEKNEALECQVIDADCNDCKFFKRQKTLPLSQKILDSIKNGECPNYTSQIWIGECLKFNRQTEAYPKKWTGRSCFEHRRS